jgi:hypothetical protein
MFPYLNILQHYVKFNIHTIIMLEKLLGVGSFGGYIDHLTHCQTIFLLFQAGSTSFLWFGLWLMHF